MIITVQLPLYNGDIEAKGQPTEVKALWDLFHSADGVLVGNPVCYTIISYTIYNRPLLPIYYHNIYH